MNNIPNIFRMYKYNIDIFSIIIGNEVINIDPKYVTSMAMEKDFDNDSFPVFQIEFSMDDKVYYKLLENKENTQFKIRIMKYLYDHDNRLRSKRVMLNDVFISFIDEEAPQIDKNIKKRASDESLTVANKSLRVFLFKKLDLVNTKNYINFILNDVILIDAVTYCLATSSIKNVLISPFHNTKRYDEIRIPPLTLLDTLDFIENVYDGYYDNGSIKFFDFDCMYFIDKGKSNNVYRANEFTQNIISILDPLNTTSMTSGCFIDESAKKMYINVNPSAFNHSSVSILNEHINANNAIIISPTDGQITMVEPSVRQMTGKVYKLLIDRYNNKRSITNYTNLALENDSIFNISMQGVDVNSLTPNKQYNIVFQDNAINNKLGGYYRINKVYFLFKKEADEFSIKAETEFKKVR